MPVKPNDWPADSLLNIVDQLAAERMLLVFNEHLRAPSADAGEPWTVCRIHEALFNPGDHVRIAYVLFDDKGSDRREWPDGEICYIRYPVRDSMSRRGTVVQAHDIEFELYRFPNDRRLRGLRHFAGRDRAATAWQRWLSEDEPGLELLPETLRRSLLRYVPEQKWIVHLHARCHDGVAERDVKRSIAVRSASVEQCQRIYARLIALRRARQSSKALFRVPKPVALDTKLGLLATRWSWGDSLLDLLRSEDPAPVLHHVAAGLNAFHGVPIDDLPERSPADDLAFATQAATDIACVLPALRSDLDEILVRLSQNRVAWDEKLARTIHGDFHWNQFRGRANRLTILDLERCARGDPRVDVANFAAQMSTLSDRKHLKVTPEQTSAWSRAFLSAWEDVTGNSIDVAAVRWYSTVSLLTLARGVMRHLRTGWPEMVECYVARALDASLQRDDLEIVA